MTAIIIDDEPKARSMLRKIVEEHFAELIIVDEADSVKSAVKMIHKQQPDLIFLDIEMPVENGFALFDYFDEPSFSTIFCTAYSEYALKAFEVSAIDYVLKPINISKLGIAIEKAQKKQVKNQISTQVSVFKENMLLKKMNKIALPTSEGLVFVKLEDILYFEAERSNTNVFTANGSLVVSRKIKDFDSLLHDDGRFFRIHRSYFINMQQIEKYNKTDGNYLIMNNQKNIPVAREKKNGFDELLVDLSK